MNDKVCILLATLESLNSLRESVAQNEDNIETLQQTLVPLGNTPEIPESADVVRRVTQLEEANTSRPNIYLFFIFPNSV